MNDASVPTFENVNDSELPFWMMSTDICASRIAQSVALFVPKQLKSKLAADAVDGTAKTAARIASTPDNCFKQHLNRRRSTHTDRLLAI
jgi:hypothetical protein